jgi:nucleotide-binding universal stress UspA family protein
MPPIEAIVVGVSHSPASETALRWALDEAKRTDRSVPAVDPTLRASERLQVGCLRV